MARQKLEQLLDFMFAVQLTSPGFLETCVEELANHQRQDDSAIRIQRLTAEVNNLREKRNRVLEAFVDGDINREERKLRLEPIDRDIRLSQELLARTHAPSGANLESLIKNFACLVEWQYWTRDQKRTVLTALVPDIRVADYQIHALGVHPTLFSNEGSHRDTGSSPLPA
jgi:hypothetical protein